MKHTGNISVRFIKVFKNLNGQRSYACWFWNCLNSVLGPVIISCSLSGYIDMLRVGYRMGFVQLQVGEKDSHWRYGINWTWGKKLIVNHGIPAEITAWNRTKNILSKNYELSRVRLSFWSRSTWFAWFSSLSCSGSYMALRLKQGIQQLHF